MTLGAGGGTLDANNSLLEVDEVINGQGALTVVDSANSMGTSLGKVLLTGNNTYSGGTVVDHATLAVNIDDNLGAASGGVTLNGGILQANMSDFSSARNIVLGADSGVLDPNGFNLTFSGNISGGTLGVGQTLSNGGSVTLSGTNNTYSGGTFIEGASLQAGGVNVLGNNGMVVMNRANNWDADLSLNGFDQTIGSLTGGVNSTVQLGHATLTTGGNDATSTFAGVISDSNDQQGGKIVKVGHGYFTLSGDNTYSGGTELDGGTVVISKDSNLGDSHGGITMGGGTLQLAGMVNSSRSLTLNSGGGTIDTDGNLSNFSGPVTGTGHLTVTDSYVGSSPLFMTYSFFPVNAGRGTLVLSGADNDYSGGTTVDGAVLRAGATNAFGTGGVNLISENISDPGSGSPIPMLVLSQGQNAVLDLSGYSQSIVSLTGDANSSVQLGGATLTVGSDGANTTFAGVISDCSDGALSCAAGSLVKVGPGTFSLTGNNSYAGGTTLSGGTLAVNSDQALGSTLANAALTFDGGALQNLASFNSSRNLLLNGAGTWDTNGFNSVASGNISGEGPLTKDGSGILTLSGTGNSYTGGTTVNGGTLQAGAQDVFGLGRVALANGSTLDLHNFNQTITSLSDDASGTQVTLGNAMLRVGTDNTNTTYSGIISGSGSLDKVGAGVLTLAGANTYQGGTSVDGGGTLAISHDNNLGAFFGGLSLDNGTLLTLGGLSSSRQIALHSGGGTINTNSFDSTLSGVIGGVGSLTKTGTGTLTLLGANTYSGGTILNDGTLAVGSAGAPAGGFSPFGSSFGAPGFHGVVPHVVALSGTPLGAGNFTLNGGTLKLAGPDFGTILVNGNYTQTGGILELKIGGGADSGLFDVLKVGGVATLGGTLQLDLTGGTLLTPGKGASLNIVQASSILGSFNVVSQSAGLHFTWNSTTGLLDVEQASFASLASNSAVSYTANQAAVAANMDLLTPHATTGDLHTLVGNLNNVLIADVPAALSELSPQRYEMYSDVAFRTAAFNAQELGGHLERLRSGATGLDMAGMLPHQASGPEALLADASMGRHAPEQWDFPTTGLLASANGGQGGATGSSYSVGNNLGAFVSGNAVFGKLDATSDLQKSNFTTSGTMGGLDYRLSDKFVAGLLFSYAHTQADLDNEGSTSSIDAYSPGLYATYFDGPFHWDGLFSYSRNEYKADRNVIFTGINRTAHSQTEGNQFSMNADSGYDFKVNHFRVGPTVGLEYVRLDVDGFTESGAQAADLTVKSQGADSLRTRLGTKLDRPFTAKGIVLDPEVRAAWQHEYLDDSRDITAAFSDPSAALFAVHTTAPQRDSALLGAGMKAQLTKNFDLYLDYNAQVGQKSFIAQGVQGGGRLRF